MPETLFIRTIREVPYVPHGFEGKVSAVCRSKKDCEDLVHFFGGDPSFCPFLPVLLWIPGAPQQIAGWGLAPAAEMRDQAVAVWELITARMDRTGKPVDFDALREKHGLMRAEDVDAATREALWERIKRHKANPVTDPPRIPHYVLPNERSLHFVSNQDWRPK